jgi:phosphoribosylanthranilate isomerase
MPKLPGGARMGYAGGIHPKNVLTVIERIEAFTPEPFWIDMETGVRDKDDRFDLARVREVLEKVKGVIKP